MIAANKPLGARINANHPINKGLVGCWLLNEMAGSKAFDCSGYNNHGTLTNFGLSGTTSNWRPTPNGGGLYFDGSNDYVDCGSGNIFQWTDKISVCAWKRRNSITPSNSGEGIVAKFLNPTNESFVLYDRKNVKNATHFEIGIGGTYYDSSINITTYDTNWHFVVGVYDGTTVMIYYDGIKQTATTSITGNIKSVSSPVTLGTYQKSDDFFNGTISDVMIWNRALTNNEVQQLYTNPHIGLI